MHEALRAVYEQILERPLEAARFRRRALATGVLEPTGQRAGAAVLYRLSRRAVRRAGDGLRFGFGLPG